MKPIISLIRGNSRYENVCRALDEIAADIDLSHCEHLVIKPNLVSTTNQLASTHVDAVRAVLDFLRSRYQGAITIAEGSAVANTRTGFEYFGYDRLAHQYRVSLLDLNRDDSMPVEVFDRHLRPQTLQMARTIVDCDYRISVGPPKTHDTVLVTLSLKNMIMGALINRVVAGQVGRKSPFYRGLRRLQKRLHLGPPNDKIAMHQGYAVINLNLALLAPVAQPHLAVIDGYEAMEGNGPMNGDPVPWRIAIAGTNALAADGLAASLMGILPAEVGYLYYCERMGLGVIDPAQMQIVGNVAPHEVRHSFQPHENNARQYRWQLPDIDRYLPVFEESAA